MYYVQDKTDKKYQVWTKAIKFFCALKISQKNAALFARMKRLFTLKLLMFGGLSFTAPLDFMALFILMIFKLLVIFDCFNLTNQ